MHGYDMFSVTTMLYSAVIPTLSIFTPYDAILFVWIKELKLYEIFFVCFNAIYARNRVLFDPLKVFFQFLFCFCFQSAQYRWIMLLVLTKTYKIRWFNYKSYKSSKFLLLFSLLLSILWYNTVVVYLEP